MSRSHVIGGQTINACTPLNILTPASDWSVSPSGVIGGALNLTFGSGGVTGGVSGYDYELPVESSGTRHLFNYTISKNAAGGDEVSLKVEILQFGSLIASDEFVIGDVSENKTIEFFPTANFVIQITETSPSAANRDAFVSNMNISSTCEGDESSFPDICDINEYIHNIKDFYLAIAHEGAGGTSLVINFNGLPVTYQNLLNATDIGGGQVNFSAGVNQNFNRRGSTVEFMRKVGDVFQIIKPATGTFDTQRIDITTNSQDLAEQNNNTYELFYNATTFRLRDESNTDISINTPENGITEVERTLAGIKVTHNGVVVYETESKCVDYNNEITSTFIRDGVDVSRFDDFDTLTALPVNATPNTSINTGVDLNEVDKLVLSFTRLGQQHVTGTINLNDFVYDSNTGGLGNWWDNTGIRIRINTADKSSGIILMSSLSNQVELQRIEFKKKAIGVSQRLGEFVHIKSSRFIDDSDAMDQGYLPVKPGTILGGATDYPNWASIYTEFIVGNDIVFPADVEGLFLRNLGGNAGLEGDFQDSENKSHSHTYTRPPLNQFTGRGNGTNVARRSTNSSVETSLSGGVESRPLNRAYQLYTIVDTYLEINNGLVDFQQDLSNPVSNKGLSTIGLKEIFNSKWITDSEDQSLWQAGRTLEALANQQANIHETYLSTTVTPTISGTYIQNTNVTWSHNAGGDNLILRSVVTGGSISSTIEFSNIEPQDINGLGGDANVIVGGNITGTVNSGTDLKHNSTHLKTFELVAGVTYTFLTQFTTQTANDEGTCHSGFQSIELYKIP